MSKPEMLRHNEKYPQLFRIEGLSVKAMYDIIAEKFLRLEEQHYRNGWVFPPEAKLLFLVGTDEIDVTKAETSTGIPIYTKQADHIKAPEIVEAISAISDHFERERNAPNVLSELADVWYNLIQLTRLDPDFALIYQKCIDQLCLTSHIPLEGACQLVLLKYKIRLLDNVGGKEHHDENEAIKLKWSLDHDSTLYDDAFDEVYRLLNKMSSTILKPRLLQLQTVQAWEWEKWSVMFEIDLGSRYRLYTDAGASLLLRKFRDSLHPEAHVVVHPVINGQHGANMSLSFAYPNTQYIARSRLVATQIVESGFMAFHQDPFRFKPQREIDVLWLDSDRNLLLSSVRDGGYVIQSEGNGHVRRPDYKPIGVLTFDRDTHNPIFDPIKPWEYRMIVETDEEFKAVSDWIARDVQKEEEEGKIMTDLTREFRAISRKFFPDETHSSDEANEQPATPTNSSIVRAISYGWAKAIVNEIMGESSNITGDYKEILRRYQDEHSEGPLHKIFRQHQITFTSLPYKRYGWGEDVYFVYQRTKNKASRYPGNWGSYEAVDKGSWRR